MVGWLAKSVAQHLPAVDGPSKSLSRVFFDAMVDHLYLEADLSLLAHGDSTTLQFHIVARSVGFCLCQTRGKNQTFFTDALLPVHEGNFAIFHAEVRKVAGRIWLTNKHDTEVLTVPALDFSGLSRVVEGCAGIGAVDQGYEACGAQVILQIDNNRAFADWLTAKGVSPVIKGNVADMETVQEALRQIQASHLLSGGFSCQPFSVLGDRRGEHDRRSESLPGLLRLAYHLGSLAVILECTPEAGNNEWVMSCLKHVPPTSSHCIIHGQPEEHGGGQF